MPKPSHATQHPMVAIENGRKVLRVGGVIQSVAVDFSYTPDVWDALVPPRPVRNALILGLGGGTVAALLTRAYGPIPIVGVERDPTVVWLARKEFGLEALPNLRIETADAFEFMRTCHEQFDAIILDLYTAGKIAHGVLSAGFLRDVTRALSPGGSVLFNLWRSAYLDDQVRRISRHLKPLGFTAVDDNIVMRCGAPTPDIPPIVS